MCKENKLKPIIVLQTFSTYFESVTIGNWLIIVFVDPCPSSMFRCDDDTCIQDSQKCDGRADCKNWDDEILPECSQSKQNRGFFENPVVGITGIFLLLKYENELEIVTSDFSCNSVSPWQIYFCIQINLVVNYFHFIVTRCNDMP